MSNLIIGTLENGNKCVYDTPNEIKNAEQFKALIYGYNDNQRQREELQGQPLLLGLNGPMLLAHVASDPVPIDIFADFFRHCKNSFFTGLNLFFNFQIKSKKKSKNFKNDFSD